MNIRIIHPNFEINLVDTSFTMIEENNWFNDRVFTKYTYPISIVLTDEQVAQLNFLTDSAATGVVTVFDVIFFVLDVEYEAQFEIETAIGNRIEAQIRYGYEEFPNFNKKLSHLPLHKFDLVGETIREHAADMVDQGYPDVDYNFPRVFTKQFDLESDQWLYFEGSVNNYASGVFINNEYDAVNDEQVNRNVIQPLPYLLYILKTGFLDAGFTLEGDILSDPQFTKATLYSLSKFYSSITNDNKQEIQILTDDYISDGALGYPDLAVYEETIIIATPGRYKVNGNLYLRAHGVVGYSYGYFYLDGVLVNYNETLSSEKFVFLDFNFDVLPGQSNVELRFEYRGKKFGVTGGTNVYDATVLDVTIVQLTAFNPDGSADPTLIFPDEIDLTQCVPNKTFGELWEAIKAWKNYDIDVNGSTVTMNLIKDQIGKGPVVDLQEFEVMEPERRFNQSKTIEIKFTEVDSDEYEFPSIYVDVNGVQQSPYTTKDDTEEITIDAIALPLKTEDSIRTADGFIDDDSKIQLVLYDGLIDNLNLAIEDPDLNLINIYPTYYKGWIDFRLRSVTHVWTFQANENIVKKLIARSTPFAYGRYHVVKVVNKQKVADDVLEVEIELSSIE